jgi:hypothetical protein
MKMNPSGIPDIIGRAQGLNVALAESYRCQFLSGVAGRYVLTHGPWHAVGIKTCIWRSRGLDFEALWPISRNKSLMFSSFRCLEPPELV